MNLRQRESQGSKGDRLPVTSAPRFPDNPLKNPTNEPKCPSSPVASPPSKLMAINRNTHFTIFCRNITSSWISFRISAGVGLMVSDAER